jgi:hypothetical protein
MNPSASLGLLLCALAAIPASSRAAAPADALAAQYRCTVLGEAGACGPPSALPRVRIEEVLEPGPWGRYLVYLGASPQEAIAQACGFGEHSLRRTVRITTSGPASGLLAYERVMGRAAAPVETIEVLRTEIAPCDGARVLPTR